MNRESLLTRFKYTVYIFILFVIQVCGCISAYYELRHQRPKLQKLKKLLEETAYRGETFEKQMKNSFTRVGRKVTKKFLNIMVIVDHSSK